MNEMFLEMKKYSKQIEKNKKLLIKKYFSDITILDIEVIELLFEREMYMYELAEKLDITKGSATNRVNRLVKKELLSISADKIDKRKKQVSLTPDGFSVYDKFMQLHYNSVKNVIEDIELNALELFRNINVKMDEINTEIKYTPLNKFSTGDIIEIKQIRGDKELKKYFEAFCVEEGCKLQLVEICEDGFCIRGDQELFIDNEDLDKVLGIISI